MQTIDAAQQRPAERVQAAAPRPEWVVRFGRTERMVHWVQATAFLLLLATGLILGISQLEIWVGHRASVREIHLVAAFFFVFGPALVALAGDFWAVRADARAVDEWTRDDLRWLRHPQVNPGLDTPPAAKFNAGQKLNAIFTVYSTVAFTVTGLILWQNRRFPFDIVSQARTIHLYLAYLALFVFLGHLYLAVGHPATRHAFHSIIFGTVRRDWAEHHHPGWQVQPGSEAALHASAVGRALAALIITGEGALLLSRWGFEWLGANATDPVIRILYDVTALPGTVANHVTAVHSFDLAALIWAGLAIAVGLGIRRGQALLPRTISVPAKP